MTYKPIEKLLLEDLYLQQQKNPYEIAKIISVNHKTVRRYLKLHEIPLRTPSEYNYLKAKTHEIPSEQDLLSVLSIAAHIAYLCEGSRSNCYHFQFCNTDPNLIKLEIQCLKQIYKVKDSSIRLRLLTSNIDKTEGLLEHFPEARIRLDLQRKRAIIYIDAGGKYLFNLFLDNASNILENIIL